MDEALVRLKPAEAGQLIELLKRVHATLSERVPHPIGNPATDGAAATPVRAAPRRSVAAASRDGAEATPAPVAAVEVGR